MNAIPNDICKLIGNSDLLQKITDDTITAEKIKWPVNNTAIPAFCKLYEKYNLPRLLGTIKEQHLLISESKDFISVAWNIQNLTVNNLKKPTKILRAD